MGNYQPRQGLTWKYNHADGKLSINVTVYVDLDGTERVGVTISAIRTDTTSLLLSLNGTEVSPINRTIDNVADLSPNLSLQQVQIALRNLHPITVITTFYVNGVVAGEVINTTSINSEIEIA